MALSDLIIGAESGGRNIGNPRSSAFGPGQFLSSTWLDMLRRTRPDLASLPRDQQLALRSDPALSRQMTDAYARQNADYLRQRGHDPTPGNTYLAHFAGPGGAASVLSADPRTKVADILGPKVVAANPFLANMSAGDLRGWAARKMGVPIPKASIPQAPLPAPTPVPPNAMAQAGPPQGLPPGMDPNAPIVPRAVQTVPGQIIRPPAQAPAGGILGGLQQGAPAQPPMPQNAQAAPQWPPGPQGMPQAAGQAAAPSIFDMIRNALPAAPNLPLFAGGQGAQQAPQQGQIDPALAAWYARQNTYGG
jgi:hypothetical protein